ncbi:peptidoglycan-binding domain-containing protein [uncultured Roseibium sp.]|uniref:peptidoglycan-binding domain-containing protein n=1 Tax=uncultured Roseibium sp. TaxID=1936171 RepID=UPI0026321294|nr:peptidoglycan-binding domain-containing protein [uncultured Roseibium sp.]
MPTYIKRGHSGQHVVELQERLNAITAAHYEGVATVLGFTLQATLVVDGKFGKNTRARVMEFQKNNGLTVDGIVGPQTWSALFGKPMPAAIESQASQAEASKSAAPRQRGHLYIHSYDAPSKNMNGSQHAASQCHHVEVPKGRGRETASLVRAELEEENLLIEDLVLNSHGSGIGIVSFGDLKFRLGDNLSFFRDIKPRLAGSGIVWIFACAFATPVKPKSDSDAWIVEPSEIARGKGTQQMVNIARHLNRPVRAGFGMQFGDMSGFTTPWAEVSPKGDIVLHSKGRKLTTFEAFGKGANELIAFSHLLVTGDFL